MEFMMLALIAALDWATFTWWIDVVLKVSIGLGAVIFVHELGHYLVARACGVKIEKFMVGFDIGGYKLSWRRGETIYGIGILPLGGYVKMLGQDDDPAHIAEQMKKSELNSTSGDAVPITGPDGETYYIDRRSYLAKSVPQRMAIISAGVVMNIIFAFIFAVIAFGMGVPYIPSIVSETVPGSPAWEAGIAPGDEIIQFGERRNPTFMQLKSGVTLGDLDDGIPCLVRRADGGEIVAMSLKPEQEGGRLATIGVGGPLSLELRQESPVLKNSAAAQAKLVAPDAAVIEGEAKFQSGDRIVRIGAERVEEYGQLSAELARNAREPLLVTVARERKVLTDDAMTGAVVHADEPQELTFEVPLQPLQRFGLVMKMGPIAAIRDDSPAAQAGLLEGDVVEAVDGEPPTAVEEGGWDPLTLPSYLAQAAAEGREVELTVRRAGRKGDAPDSLTVGVAPTVPKATHLAIPPGSPMPAEAIGMAYRIENEVVAVRPGSSAARAGIETGDQITLAKIIAPEDDPMASEEPVTVELSAEQPSWPSLIDELQFRPAGTEVELTVVRGQKSEPRTVRLRPEASKDAFIAQRGFLLETIVRTRQAETFADQLRLGWDETAGALTMVFRFLEKLGGQVPITALGGPVTIAKAAGYSAAEGLPTLLIFLTMLSANLAVLNFLPIPLLDGGHMVFLAYEGLRGRPANERFVVALHTAGFIFIVGLMLYVLALDFNLIPRNL